MAQVQSPLPIPEGSVCADCPPAAFETLQSLYNRLTTETPDQFQAGRLHRERIERVLGSRLQFGIPLTLREIADPNSPLSVEHNAGHRAPPRPFTSEARSEFDKHLA